MPTQNLLTSLNGSLGYFSLAVLYFCMASFGPVAPWAVSKLGGAKRSIAAGALTYLIFQVANVLIGIRSIPTMADYFVLLPPSGILGIGACILWTAEGYYVSRVSAAVDASGTDAKVQNDGIQGGDQAIENTLGYVNGVVLCFLQSANLIMNLGTSALLSSGQSAVTLFLILAVASGLGFFVLTMLPSAPQLGPEPPVPGFCESFSSVLSLHRERQVLVMIPLFIATGINQGYLFSTITGDVITPSLGKEWIGYVMATSAAVDAFGSFALGRISDSYGRTPVLLLGGLFNIAPMIAILILGVPGNAYALCFGAAICLGISDAVWMTMCCAMIPELVPKAQVTDTFALFTTYRSFMTAAFSLLGPFIPLNIRTWILTVVVALTGVQYSCFRPRRYEALEDVVAE